MEEIEKHLNGGAAGEAMSMSHLVIVNLVFNYVDCHVRLIKITRTTRAFFSKKFIVEMAP